MGRIARAARNGVFTAASALALATATLVGAPAGGHAMTTVNAAGASGVVALAAPVVAMAATPTGHGYWRAAADGGVLTAGDARFYGSAAGLWHAPIVAMATTPSGHGYWLVDQRGYVFHFGDAIYRGGMGGRPLAHPIVGMSARADGQGYWLVASDGGIFAFNAPFKGSTGSIRLNRPIVGMSARPDGQGYWLVASDGGIFAFNAPFKGSTGSMRLNRPIVGMASLPNGTGYTMVGSDGGLFRFPSSSPFYGSAVNACPGGPAVSLAMSPGAVGYWIAFADGRTFAFSPTSAPPKCGPSGASKYDLMAADLFTRLNQERAARNLPPMVWDPTLAGYAMNWSASMAGSRNLVHSNIGVLIGASTPNDMVGENIAANYSTGGAHVSWMGSDGHRSNMLSPDFTRVGIGAACTPDGVLYVTQDFTHRWADGPAPPASTPPPTPVARPDTGGYSC